MPNTSFIQKLRMNGIFPSDGGLNPGKPFGMPDLDTGGYNPQILDSMLGRIYPLISQEKEKERSFQREMLGNQSNLRNIANRIQNQPEPMNIVEGRPVISDFQKANLGLKERELAQKGELEREKLYQTGELEGRKITQTGKFGQENINIRQQRANVYDFKAHHPGMIPTILNDGTIGAFNKETGKITPTNAKSIHDLTDSDKVDLIHQNDIQNIETRGDIQGNLQREKLRTTGEQNLANIAARIKGQEDIQANKPTKEILPTQIRVQQNNTARQLINTRPDLAPFITLDPDTGNYNVAAPSEGNYFGRGKIPKDKIDEINQLIYGKPESKVNPIIKPTEGNENSDFIVRAREDAAKETDPIKKKNLLALADKLESKKTTTKPKILSITPVKK